MSWARFDDNAGDSVKLEKAGDVAGMLWFRAILWSRKHRTDGFIPVEILPRLTRAKDANALAKRLVDASARPGGAGLFEVAEGGYRIHDFEDYGPPSREAEPPTDTNGASRRSAAAKKAAAARWSAESNASAPHDASDANASASHDANASEPHSVADANASAPHDASEHASDADANASRADARGHARASAPAFPSRPVPEEKKKPAGAHGESDPVVAILAGSGELTGAGVDLARLAATLRGDAMAGGWSEKRIASCLPYALDALRLSRDPGENPLGFVVKVVRRVAPPRQLEAELAKTKPKADTPKTAAALAPGMRMDVDGPSGSF